MTAHWPVVPICEKQKMDIRKEDLIEGGLYRTCDVSRAGNREDPLPEIISTQFDQFYFPDYTKQFVVQLQGCPLSCPYCYVTHDGVHGTAKLISTDSLIEAFQKSGCNVFHLMGGAPGIYIYNWPELISRMRPTDVFHSDLLLVDVDYDADIIEKLCTAPNAVYAVSIKGTNNDEWCRNTGTAMSNAQYSLFWNNLGTILNCSNPERFYFTFTNCSAENIRTFRKEVVKAFQQNKNVKHLMSMHCHPFSIKHYKATAGAEMAITLPKEVNHSNATLIETAGEKLYDKALYISSSKDLENREATRMNFSKELHCGKMLIQFDNCDGAYLAIGVEERKRIAAWLLEGIE